MWERTQQKNKQLLIFSIILLLVTPHNAFKPYGSVRLGHFPLLESFGEVDNDSKLTYTTNANQDAITLLKQAEVLRAEAESLQKSIIESKRQKEIREIEKIDEWINILFVKCSIDENTEMLNDVDRVFEILKDDRFSQEQVNKIFKRICETTGGPPQSRSNCSPIMTLLVDAAGMLDAMEREDNPNKRWNGRVERVLRRKLFAKDYGIELEEDDEDNNGNPWKFSW